MNREGTRRGCWTDDDVRRAVLDGQEDESVQQQSAPENHEAPAAEQQAAAEPQDMGEMPKLENMVHNVHTTIQKFWQEHKTGFVEMWDSLSGPDRKRMIMSVFPHMPEARTELMCVCGSRKCGLGMKTTIMLMPELNMEDLVGGGSQQKVMDLVSLFDHRTEDESRNNYGDALHIRRAFPRTGSQQNLVVDNVGLTVRGSVRIVSASAPENEQQELIEQIKKGAYVWLEEWEQILMRQQNVSLMLALLADEYLKEWAGVKKCYSVVAPLQFAHKWNPQLTDAELYAMEKAALFRNACTEYGRNQLLLALARAEIGRGDASNLDKAKDLKDQGNAAFTACNYLEAKRLYTRALDVFKRVENETDPWKCFEAEQYALWATCYSNRAECYLRLGEPTEAVLDVLEMLDLPRGPIPERIIDKAVDRLMRAREAAKAKPQNAKKSQQSTGVRGKPPPKKGEKQKDSEDMQGDGEATPSRVLGSGAEVAGCHVFNVAECYLCMNEWGQVSGRVLVPTCKHALCVECATTLRSIQKKQREKDGDVLQQTDNVPCGLCREATVEHVE
jgi:tetratricopeptide (TPR) repeat protein